MRAEQYMILGVSLIGAYAVYRMATNKPAEIEPGAFGTLPNPNDNSVNTSLPLQAGNPDAPPTSLALLAGPTLPLRGGAYYKARIETQPQASNAQLQQMVASALGIPSQTIEVFRTPAEALRDSAIGQTWAVARAGQGTRWIRFRVGALDSGARARPSWLVSIWQAAAPAAISGTRALAFQG